MDKLNNLKGGKSDNKSIRDIAIKHTRKSSKDPKGDLNTMILKLKKELVKGINIEKEHTKNPDVAREIAMDHLDENPNYYTNLKKVETKESMGADSAGAFEPAFNTPIVKRKINKIHNLESDLDEATDASSSGQYDVSFSAGRSNPLKINGPDSVKTSRAVKDKNFPKYGGPGGVFVKVKEKCKKYPYCNQGDIRSLEFFEEDGLVESAKNVSNKTGIPYGIIEKLILNEINEYLLSK